MPKFVAFLRAINVGNHTVKMDDLRRLFEQMGFANVETFIASGNVIFDAKTKNVLSLETKIAEFEPFNKDELDGEGNTLFIGFLSARPTNEAAKKLLALASNIDGLI